MSGIALGVDHAHAHVPTSGWFLTGTQPKNVCLLAAWNIVNINSQMDERLHETGITNQEA
jgi:hypothetical protein